jgi:hypothetical protein
MCEIWCVQLTLVTFLIMEKTTSIEAGEACT